MNEFDFPAPGSHEATLCAVIESAETDARGSDEAPEHGAPLRILVVDDDCDSAETLAQLLCARGYHAGYLCSGRDVLAAALAQRPDVLLMDIGLPDLDGCEVARRLRAEPRLHATTLIALSGYGEAEDCMRSRDAGFCFHLVKPVEFRTLERLLLQAVKRRQARGAAGPPSAAA